MKIADFRKQTTAPDNPSTSSVVGLYADTNGYLIHVTSAGVKSLAATLFSGVVPQTSIATGGAGTATGLWFGSTAGGAGVEQTGLGSPTIWIPIRYNSTTYAVPAYALI